MCNCSQKYDSEGYPSGYHCENKENCKRKINWIEVFVWSVILFLMYYYIL